MHINNSKPKDIAEIFRLYAIATAFQKSKGMVTWPTFKRTLVETEIKENRQWKITVQDQIACVWATTFDDPLIWLERNQDSAVYIHRIATNPNFRGQNLVLKIVEWAKEYAKVNHKQFIRLDTVGENKKLIAYYQKCGFDFLGLSKLTNTADLPAHYDQATVSLFEIKLVKE